MMAEDEHYEDQDRDDQSSPSSSPCLSRKYILNTDTHDVVISTD